MEVNIDVWQAITMVIIPAVVYFFLELKKQDKAQAVAAANQERIIERIDRLESKLDRIDRMLYRKYKISPDEEGS